jgi:hypothetical protein
MQTFLSAGSGDFRVTRKNTGLERPVYPATAGLESLLSIQIHRASSISVCGADKPAPEANCHDCHPQPLLVGNTTTKNS